ncbi:tetratricopeptide repeat protein [candidate division CSSED10-310 bacterium]|uniref:Tetratricopeptide repeat protein n=1 Tax=candidate division CSSED10-310 bacterium TaxID=2855610 RepID=A0ABV6YXT1_UNCC1
MAPKVFKNRYRVIKKVGEGGSGTVYLVADQLRAGREVALKTLQRKLINRENLNAFKHEFKVMSRLKHPNLIRVFDFGFDESVAQYFITMEYAGQHSLKDVLKEHGKFSEKRALDLIVILCRTFEFIHSRNIFHRDIKPDNIMVSDDHYKVMDFGLATLGKERALQTKATFHYMAPETLKVKTDHRVDIFAAGVTFFFILTGELFYSTAVFNSILALVKDAHLFEENRTLAFQKIERPELRQIIDTMTAWLPENRYQSFSEIILDLNRVLKLEYTLETSETSEAYVLGAGFVGRQKELSIMKKKLGSHQLTLVRGVAGTGKGRLFQEFETYCQLDGIDFCEGNCLQHISRTYSPFLEILNELLLDCDPVLIDNFGSEFKKILPSHECLQKFELIPLQDPKTERQLLIQSIINFFALLTTAYQKKIVLYLNNVQWIDEGSLEILTELLSTQSIVNNNNISLFASVWDGRDEDIAPFLLEGHHKARLTDIRLAPFNIDDGIAYTEAIFGSQALGTSLQETIPDMLHLAQGNPSFLQELIRAFVADDYIKRHDSRWELVTDLQHISIPQSEEDIIQYKLKRFELDDDEKFCLQIFALLERGVSLDEFQLLYSKSNKLDVARFFEEMERREVLKTIELDKRVEYYFAQATIRTVVTAEIENRAALHLHIAENMEQLHDRSPAEFTDSIAYHYSMSPHNEKAILYLERAGDMAKSQFANERAIYYYDQLLKRLPEAEKEKQIHILLKKKSLYQLIGEWPEAQKILEKCIVLAQEIQNRKLLGVSKRELGDLNRQLGNFQSCARLLSEAQAIFQDLNAKRALGITLKSIGNLHYLQYRFEPAIEFYQRTAHIATELNDTHLMSAVLLNMGNIYWMKRDFNRAMKNYRDTLDIVEKTGDWVLVTSVLNNMGMVLTDQGNYSQALEYFEKKQLLAEKLGDKASICKALSNKGLLYFNQDRLDQALEHLELSLQQAESMGYTVHVAAIRGDIANVLKYLKRHDQAEHCYNEAITLSRSFNLKVGLCINIYYKAKFCYDQQRFGEARQLLDEVLQLDPENKISDYTFRFKLLSELIHFAEADSKQARDTIIERMTSMLARAKENYQRARLHYELFLMTNQQSHGNQATNLFKQLYQEHPKLGYKSILEKLGNPG